MTKENGVQDVIRNQSDMQQNTQKNHTKVLKNVTKILFPGLILHQCYGAPPLFCNSGVNPIDKCPGAGGGIERQEMGAAKANFILYPEN